MQIIDIKLAKHMRDKINIHGIIKSKEEPHQVNLKTGEQSDVCNAIIYDKSGEIKMSLWGDDVERFHEGDSVQITNGYTSEFRGDVQLNVGKYGKITKIE